MVMFMLMDNVCVHCVGLRGVLTRCNLQCGQ